MLAQAISNKRHSLYTFAIVQLKFDSKTKFKAAYKYMEQAYGDGIHHDRTEVNKPRYNRNTGDNRVWYYTDTDDSMYRYRRSTPNYKLYLTTPEQLTMVSLFNN